MAARRAIGVDFGTSTSLVAEQIGRQPVEIAPLGRSTPWFPSVAGLRGGSLLLGEDADGLSSDQVIRSVKRTITEDRQTIQVGSDEIDADEVIVALFSEIARRAKAAEHPLDDADEVRLGCPAMWSGDQRERLLRLAAEASLPISGSSLIDEPIAAGVAWANHRFYQPGKRPKGKLLVFDMGGGTLDIAVLDIGGKDQPEISVLSALGNAKAGDTLDAAIAAQFTGELARLKVPVNSLPNPDRVRSLLLNVAREAKIRLSTVPSHQVVFRGMSELPVLTYLREQLVEAFRPQMADAEQFIWAALRAAKMTETIPVQGDGWRTHSPEELRRLGMDGLAGEIKYVLLVGGMSRIPYVGERIGALFPHAEVFDEIGVVPEEAIVAGLASTSDYERLNLHRPSFDFVLEWDGGRQVLYRAHTPIYDPWQALSMSTVYYSRQGTDFQCPRHGRGRLTVRSITGETVNIKIDNESRDHLPFRLGDDLLFRMYCDGRIIIRDGSGHSRDLRVDRWPVIRGGDFAELVLKSVTAPQPPELEGDWGYGQKEWAPPHY
ncbi:Hsp70 family protein [Microtetraspora glauca]|uniref:Hsp70 family protein n=1 Tax=Microtetraspora glauca TaxID=1996 RepID=A0ABV3GTM0_MICGL